MADTIKQSIGIAPLRCAGRKVDSVSYSGGTVLKQLSMTLKIEPQDDDDGYYRMDLSVSGLYSAKDVTDENLFNALVLSVGAEDLYAYAKRTAEILTSGGVRGDLTLPLLTFKFGGENLAS